MCVITAHKSGRERSSVQRRRRRFAPVPESLRSDPLMAQLLHDKRSGYRTVPPPEPPDEMSITYRKVCCYDHCALSSFQTGQFKNYRMV